VAAASAARLIVFAAGARFTARLAADAASASRRTPE
jgi:hypothetical protein